jgi:hypothetical protein
LVVVAGLAGWEKHRPTPAPPERIVISPPDFGARLILTAFVSGRGPARESQHRIQNRVDKNKKMLDDLQQRQAAIERAAEEVALFTQLAESKGETYDIDRDYPRQAIPPQFDFSIPEIARLATHLTRLAEAKKLLQASQRPLRKAA